MKVHTVYINHYTGVGEQCIKNINDDYIGLETGNIYPKDTHYSRLQHPARIIAVDKENETGLYHLSGGNRHEWKSKYIGGIVTVEKAHYFGDLQIYRCLELDEYFSGNEIELLSE